MLRGPEPLSRAHQLDEFSCGKPALDVWLKTNARSNQENGFTAVMVVHEDGRVDAYYGVAPTAVERNLMPRPNRTGRAPDPVPCLLLGQFAVDQRWSGHGIGSGLFRHAMLRCVEAAQLIGGRAVVVNAIDPDAGDYWKRRGFVAAKDHPMILFQSLARIAASLAESGKGLNFRQAG
ncbi:MAG TPA: N-acetyltransferase [Rhizomicrobium sp.]|nr:N-acetyltransferase [Rhizomicrobium sp.]